MRRRRAMPRPGVVTGALTALGGQRAVSRIAAAVVAVAAVVALGGCGSGAGAVSWPTVAVVPAPGAAPTTRATTPAATATTPTPTVAAAAPDVNEVPPSAIRTGRYARLTVHVTSATPLRASPGGRVVGTIRPRTEFGSPTVLAVLRRKGPWYAVLSPLLDDGQVGWISAHAALDGYANAFTVLASLSRRQVVVRDAGHVVARFPVAIGRPSNPTPPGSYAVTDKLRTEDPASPYGCCVLALTGHQLNVPQDWGGGDRLAIHATDAPSSIGYAASLGCLRAPETTMRRLITMVPLGTIVTISSA